MAEVKIFKQYEIPVINPEDSPFVKSGDGYYAKNSIQSMNYSPNSSTGWKLGENGESSSIPTSFLNGDIDLENLNIASQGWTSTLTFSSTDYNTVAWTSGTITTASGTSYSISAGNTGNMSNPTYIYLDVAASTTALQITTTASSSVGAGKILICVANNVSDTNKDAEFQAFGGKGGISKLITADVIAAGTITADEIATNTITAAKMNVSTISSISANIGTITSGTITGVLLQTSSSSNTGIKIGTVGSDTGIFVYGQTFKLLDTSGNLYGYIGGYSGYYNIATYNNRNMLLDAGSATVHFYSHAAPLNDGGKNLGYYNYRWGNCFTLNLTFENGYYLNKNGNALQLNGLNRLTMDGGTFRRVGFTFKDSAGNNKYIEVLATADPV